MMNGPREHHDHQPAANAKAPDSGMPLARSPSGSQPDPLREGCSSAPDPDFTPVDFSTPEPVVAPVELPPASQADPVADDVWDVCSALLDTIERRVQSEMLPPLPAIQTAKTPSKAKAPSLPAAVVVGNIPPDLPVPDCQTCGGVDASGPPSLLDSVIPVIECVAGCDDEPQATLRSDQDTPLSSEETLLLSQEKPLLSQETPQLSQELQPVHQDSVPMEQEAPVLSEETPPSSQETHLPNQEMPPARKDPAPVEQETPASPGPPVLQEVPSGAAPALNCSRFGRVRKRPRLSPPDTPVKKPKVVFKVTELGPFPAPAKKQKVVFKAELGLFPSQAKKPGTKSKAAKPKAETSPDKKLKTKTKNKATKPEPCLAPAKKLKINPKATKPGPPPATAPGLPTPVKTAKSKATRPEPASVPDRKPKGSKPNTSLKLAKLECRHIKNKWNPGDVVWFKVSKEPYWPGKVTHDDATGEFKRIRGGMNEYCLLPFGQHASYKWVLAPMMLNFHGRQQFEEHKQSLLDKHPEDSPTRSVIETKFSVTNFKLEEWVKVVQETENGYLNGRFKAIKVEVGEKMTNETKAALPKQEAGKNGVKKVLLGDSLLVPQKRSQKLKDPGMTKKQKQKKAKTEASTASQKIAKTKSTGTHSDAVPKKTKKKQKHGSLQPAAVDEKPDETSELNDTASSVESTIQEVINFAGQCPSVQEPATLAEGEDVDAKPKKKSSGNKKKVPTKNEPKKAPVPDDSRGKKVRKKSPDPGSSPHRPSKKKVKTSPLKRFLNELGQHSGDSDSGSSAKKDNLPAEGKNEKVCQACEQIIPSSDGIRCVGNCNSTFHAGCAKPTETPVKDGNYKCKECTTGLHSCFVCKNAGGEIRRCSIRLCGKFYHPACLDLYRITRIDGDHITCSLHSCISCALNLNTTSGKKGRMVRCLRCPVAYHFTEDCLAAGSLVVSHSAIVCPKHYEPKKMAKMMHVNVNWCFVCSLGGSLICCESCPASFHAECLGIVPPEGSYYCAECLAGTQPKYGIIVWVKLGSYRWWPAKIINPRNAPSNIRNMPHQVGEFPVCFFGTHDYYWTTRSRVFQFLEGDQGAHDNTANRLAKRYEKALNEACVAYHEWKIAKECRAAQDYEKNSLIPPRYKPIKVNRPVGRVSMTTADPSQMTPCDCDPNSENPCGSDSECLNRMLMFECHPSVCAAGEKCQNQRFEKRQYVPAEIFKAEGKGWGLRNLVDIKKGEFVNEYIGEIIDEKECRLRMKRMHEENNTNYYFLTIDKDRIIDAARKGNLSRFMNHSCQPNCETHKWTVNGNTRVGLFAVCDIPKGTELTFNYNLDCLGNNKTTCRCEAPNCSGFIGERPKRATQIKACQKENDKVAGMKRKRRKKAAVKCEHEDECFRCGHDGELLMCDRKNCPKAYHLSCLNLEKPPYGRWECPWHHCDICGRVSMSLCLVCPNSYCKEHTGENIKTHEDGVTYCSDHIKEDEAIHRSVDSLPQKPTPAEDVAPRVAPTIINLKKKKCERARAVEKKAPSAEQKRQRMIAEKLKIKLNGSKKHGYPTCRRVRDLPKGKVRAEKRPPNGVLKPTVKIKPLLNGTKKHCKAKAALGGKGAKKPAPKAVLVAKLNGKTVKLAAGRKGAKSADRSEGAAERTEKSAPPAGEAAAELPLQPS